MHHGACLRVALEAAGSAASDAEALEASLIAGSTPTSFAGSDAAIVAFVRKLTRTPAAVTETDIADLRAHGISDREIYDVTSIAGFFAYVNRIAQGMGVPLEENWRDMLEP